MAKLDFPSSPTGGQKYPVPTVPGQPVYTWDGEKWTSIASTYIPGTAPFDALAYNGMQINGSMEISQEKGYAATTTNSLYVIDGWRLYFAGTMAVSASNGVTNWAPGIQHSFNLSVTTAQTSLGATDHTFLIQNIEGWRIARLAWGTANAQPITIGFWSAHQRTGLYSVAIRNSGNRSCVVTYTQVAAGIAQYNVMTVLGDTVGVWSTDNTTGISVTFTAAAGSTYITATPNTWLAGSFLAATGQVNGVAATSDVLRITGVVVLPGTQAPTAAQSPNIMRPYDQELVTCQRYYEKLPMTRILGAFPVAGNYSGAWWQFKTTKRATPTITLVGSAGAVETASLDYVCVILVTSNAVIGGGTTADARL